MNSIIPFLCRHVFGIPRTVANQNKVRLRLKELGSMCLSAIGFVFLAACAYVTATIAFAL